MLGGFKAHLKRSKGASSWLPQQREGLIIWVPFFIDQKYDQQQILLTIYI
jgi:hypothetical protein